LRSNIAFRYVSLDNREDWSHLDNQNRSHLDNQNRSYLDNQNRSYLDNPQWFKR
jgi:hypothetical protein